MNGGDSRRVWKNLKQRLGLKGMGCCGAAMWRFRTQTLTIMQREVEQEQESHMQNAAVSVTMNMNLAMALAAERNLRGSGGGEHCVVGPNKNTTAVSGTAVKTLMMLIEETDGGDWKMTKEDDVEGGGREGNDWMCCVCMERNKGAAFIPCGHTYCRVCSRDLWLNRGSCPICNSSILEILDIF